jgi:hypothetical protein
MGEMERSSFAQEMICGVMISNEREKQCSSATTRGSYHVNDHNASVTHHVNL